MPVDDAAADPAPRFGSDVDEPVDPFADTVAMPVIRLDGPAEAADAVPVPVGGGLGESKAAPVPERAAGVVLDAFDDLDHDVAAAIAEAVVAKVSRLVAPSMLRLVAHEISRTVDAQAESGAAGEILPAGPAANGAAPGHELGPGDPWRRNGVHG